MATSKPQKLIISPMATGNGAYIVHKILERHISGYQVAGYHPNWTFAPFFLRKVAPAGNASLIHTTPAYAIFSYRRSIPLVISFQNYVLDGWMKPYSTRSQWFHYRTDQRLWFRMAVQKAHSVTAVSRATAELVKQDMNINDPVKIIYNGVDTEHFTPSLHPEHPGNKIRVFYSGNLTRRKGAHWLPAIANKLAKGVKIYYTQGLRTRHKLPAHPNLQPLGPVPYEDMPARYRQMDILVMPTVREGLSLSVLEAMASGLPVVASNCSSLPEQIDDHKGGFLCPAGDADIFAEKINLLAESSKLREEMGDYNRAKVEKFFTVGQMVKAYKALFEEVLRS
jgi:glycosyltransferase involved in cell wall biosynthesis